MWSKKQHGSPNFNTVKTITHTEQIWLRWTRYWFVYPKTLFISIVIYFIPDYLALHVPDCKSQILVKKKKIGTLKTSINLTRSYRSITDIEFKTPCSKKDIGHLTYCVFSCIIHIKCFFQFFQISLLKYHFLANKRVRHIIRTGV